MFSRMWIGIKVFFCYLIPFFPCCPRIGNLEEADCIFIQAFGRNSIPDAELGEVIWKILSKGFSLTGIFTLLSRNGFESGEPNKVLARKTLALAKKYGVPIIGQWEVIYAIWQLDRRWFFDHREEIDCLWPPRCGYYSTWEVKLASKEKMKARGKKRPIEVCHPAMTARVIPILWKIKIGVVVEGVYPWNFYRHPLWVWDKDSVQPWVRAFIKLQDPRTWWLARESYGRFVHHPLYRYISFIPPN